MYDQLNFIEGGDARGEYVLLHENFCLPGRLGLVSYMYFLSLAARLRQLSYSFVYKRDFNGVTGDAVMANFARQMLEVVPSIRHSGGFTAVGTALSVHVRMLHMDGSVIDEDLVASPLIYKLWHEAPAAPALFCAHVAVVNSNTSSYAHFEFTIVGGRPPAGDALQAKRIFTPGAWHSA